jgi:SPP1 gp7 family putative phage head morphogenesis protein
MRTINQKRAKHFADDDLEIPSAFEKALEFFFAKKVINKTQFNKLSAELRRRAFTIVADMRDYLLSRVRDMLHGYIESGGTIEEFVAELEKYFAAAGVTRRNRYYLETVFNTNVQEALARGKDEIYEEADEDEFPYRQFLTVGDDRVRGPHMVLDGFTAPKNDPIWRKLRVPLSYNCRCSITLVHKDEEAVPTDPAKYPALTGRGYEFVN